jgi:hypothetical protein
VEDETLTIRTSDAGRECGVDDDCHLLSYWILESPNGASTPACYTHLLHRVSDFADESQVRLSLNHLNEIDWVDGLDL